MQAIPARDRLENEAQDTRGDAKEAYSLSESSMQALAIAFWVYHDLKNNKIQLDINAVPSQQFLTRRHAREDEWIW